MTPPVRPAEPADRPALRRLQAHLPEPAPELLAYGLDVGAVLVSDAPDAGSPVGYLLAVGVTLDRGGAGTSERSSPERPLETPGRPGPSEPAVPPEASDAGTTSGGRGAHLAELVVAPGCRREGRATALLDRFLAVADGPVTVAVEPDNDPALALYRSRGFERVGRREDYFETGPALWLVRE
ncbi:MAG: GNAT family N-acetyltransferase [Haloferacaceae archaeon]